MCMSWQWLDKLWLVNLSIKDTNTCVCSHHFTDEDFVKPVLKDFETKKLMLKERAYSVFFLGTC